MEPVLCNAAGHPRVTGHDAWLSPRPLAEEQRSALPGRPTHDRGDHRRHACRRRQLRRRPPTGADRHPLASRLTDQRSARPRRDRSRAHRAGRLGSPRQGRAPPRSRHGPMGLASAPAMAENPRRSARRDAAVRHPRRDSRPALGVGRRPQAAATNSSRGRFFGASRRISCAARMRSKWPTRASRWSSFSASSDT